MTNLQQYVKDLKHGNVNQRAAALALENINRESDRWIIDQMLRLICGEAYPTIVKKYEAEHGPGSWDAGDKQLPLPSTGLVVNV